MKLKFVNCFSEASVLRHCENWNYSSGNCNAATYGGNSCWYLMFSCSLGHWPFGLRYFPGDSFHPVPSAAQALFKNCCLKFILFLKIFKNFLVFFFFNFNLLAFSNATPNCRIFCGHGKMSINIPPPFTALRCCCPTNEWRPQVLDQ